MLSLEEKKSVKSGAVVIEAGLKGDSLYIVHSSFSSVEIKEKSREITDK